MRLNTSEKIIWSACFAARYGKEQARGIAKHAAARAAAAHASNALDALRTAYDGMGSEERTHVADVLGEPEPLVPTKVPGAGARAAR